MSSTLVYMLASSATFMVSGIAFVNGVAKVEEGSEEAAILDTFLPDTNMEYKVEPYDANNPVHNPKLTAQGGLAVSGIMDVAALTTKLQEVAAPAPEVPPEADTSLSL